MRGGVCRFLGRRLGSLLLGFSFCVELRGEGEERMEVEVRFRLSFVFGF